MRSSLRFGVNPNQVGTNNFTDNLLESASYLRLRTITLSRVLPGSVTGKFGITNGRIYVTGANLWTRTNYSGFDPDVNSSGGDARIGGADVGAYPRTRTWNVGASVTY